MSEQQATVAIRYIKNKRHKEDNVNRTKIVWHGPGDVQEYPRHLAPALLQHDGVWVIANSANDPYAHEQTRAQHSREDESPAESQAPGAQAQEEAQSQPPLPVPPAEGSEVVTLKINDVEIPPGAYYVMLVPEQDAQQMELAVGAIQQIAMKAGYSVPAVAIEGELFRITSKPVPVETAEYETGRGVTQTRTTEVISPETVDSMANEDKETLKAWAKDFLYIDLNKRFSNEKLLDQMRLAAEIYQSELNYVGDPSMLKEAYLQSLQAHDMFNPEIVKVA